MPGRRGAISPGRSGWVRLVVLIALLGVGLLILLPSIRKLSSSSGTSYPGGEQPEGASRLYLPTGPSDQIVHHTYYSLGYDENHEQARWVAYRTTRDQVRTSRVKRSRNFRADPAVRTGSATDDDYRGSGLSRGLFAVRLRPACSVAALTSNTPGVETSAGVCSADCATRRRATC